MNTDRKLAILADAAKYDASCASSGSSQTRAGSRLGSTEGMGICHSYTPDGRCVSLLKILLTNYCIYDCQFCVNRVSSDTPRARFSVDEVVNLTLEFYRRNYIEGLFLSSGIIQSPDYTMEQLSEVARRLREEHSFGGYIHLKTIPGADEQLVEQAGRFADRLSVNVELPTADDLRRLAPEKQAAEITETMSAVRERIDERTADRKRGLRPPKFTPAGQSTQMVIGATETPDSSILATASSLYKKQKLRRVYYSAYSPIPFADSRLPPQPPPLVREHRLYQADWLIRFYGFQAEELFSKPAENLSLEIDPKLSWALLHRELFPVDVNTADRQMLLRIPGVGAGSVKKILSIRRHHRLGVLDLKKLRVAWKRTAPFVTTSDHTPGGTLDAEKLVDRFLPPQRQLLLFDAARSAATGTL